MSFLQYFTKPAEIPITANTIPIAIIFISRLTFFTISAPSAYPNGVMYFRNSALSVRFAVIFCKSFGFNYVHFSPSVVQIGQI